MMFGWNQKSIRRMLSNCVVQSEGSFVTFPELGVFYPAKFAKLDKRQFELEVMPRSDSDVHTASFCCVSFKQNFKPYFFVSSVLNYRKNQTPPLHTLLLELPERMFVENRRRAYRVPVQSDSGLIVRAALASSEVWVPTVANLSDAGALLTFPDDAPGLQIDTPLDLTLILDSHTVSLKAEVRRRVNQSYGVEFISVFDETGLNPPTALRDMMRTIERKWFDQLYLAS